MTSRPTPIDLTFDVSETSDLPGFVLSTVCQPPLLRSSSLPPLWACLIHGGSYDAGYWDLQVSGSPPGTYSLSWFLAEHGIGTVAIDLPGSGPRASGQWPQRGEDLTPERIAWACHQAVQQIRERLQQGTLTPGLPVVEQPLIAGLGHSFGGGIATIMQGTHETFDMLGIMGWPQGPLVIPGMDMGALQQRLVPDEHGLIDQGRVEWHDAFFLEDVPEEVREADSRVYTKFPVGILGLVASPGYTVPYASAIRVPVLVLLGERDMALQPPAEKHYFPQSADVTLYVQEGSAHLHLYSQVHMAVKVSLLHWLWQASDLRTATLL